ncbi:hypothetical protein ACQJ6Z_02445 [Helicobacter pylori]
MKECVFVGLGEWDFCLKRLSTPTQNHSLSYLRHTLTLNIRQK